jgi:hypothetical protein
MEKVYEVYIDISLEKDLMMVKAKNLTGALQETKKELNKIIDNMFIGEMSKCQRKIDTDRGLYYYEYEVEEEKDDDQGGGHTTKLSLIIYDCLDYSYVDGKKWNHSYSDCDLLCWDKKELEHLVTHGLCWCCDRILPKKDIKDNNLENICKEKGLNHEYIEDITSICNKCVENEEYMNEYNRTKEIMEGKCKS